MGNVITTISDLLKERGEATPKVIGYSTADNALFCIPNHYPGTGKFQSDVINDIRYAEYLAKLCSGDVGEVYIGEITKPNRHQGLKLYHINTTNKDAVEIETDLAVWDWVR